MIIYYVGKPYPKRQVISSLKDKGHQVGLFADSANYHGDTTIFDNIIKLDFSSRNNFRKSIAGLDKSMAIDGLACTYENYITFKAILAEHLSLPAMALAAAERCTDKLLMRQAFFDSDHTITPAFSVANSKQDILRFAEQYGYPVILKPANLVKSLLVSRCDDQSDLISNYQQVVQQIDKIYQKSGITDRKPHIIVEQFITGKMCSVAAFVDNQGKIHFCDGICGLASAQSIGINDNFLYSRKLPESFDETLAAKIMDTARKGVTALGMKATPAHIEIIYNDQEVKLVEIGARIGGYRPMMYQSSYGVDLLEQEIKTVTGQLPNPNGKLREYCAVYEVFPKTNGRFVGLANAKSPDNYAYFHLSAHPGDLIGAAKDGHKKPLVVAATSSDITNFEHKCHEIERIEVITK